MDKVILNNVTSFQNDSSAVATVNNNMATIVSAINNTLSRDGTAPNQLQATLDANNNRIINLPNGVGLTEPATVGQLTELLPAGGTTGEVLTKNSSANFDSSWQVPTAANLTGPITSTGNATAVNSQTGTGSKFVMDSFPTITGPTLVGPALGTPFSGIATNLTGTASGLTSGAVTGLTVASGKTLTANNSLTLVGTDGTTQTFPSTSGNVVTSVTVPGGDITGTYPALTIVNNAITSAKMNPMPAFTLKGNATGSSTNPTDISIPALTQKASPISGDMIMIADSAASNALKFATVGSVASAGSVSSIAGNTGAFTLTGGITNSTNAIKLAYNGAAFQGAPQGPTGTTSITLVMMGMGSVFTITPVYSTRLKIEFVGALTMASAAQTIVAKVFFGTGTAPGNGAPQTGTQIAGGTAWVSTGAGAATPFANGGIITGLTPGTAYWFDIALNSTSGTASVSCSFNGFEI